MFTSGFSNDRQQQMQNQQNSFAQSMANNPGGYGGPTMGGGAFGGMSGFGGVMGGPMGSFAGGGPGYNNQNIGGVLQQFSQPYGGGGFAMPQSFLENIAGTGPSQSRLTSSYLRAGVAPPPAVMQQLGFAAPASQSQAPVRPATPAQPVTPAPAAAPAARPSLPAPSAEVIAANPVWAAMSGYTSLPRNTNPAVGQSFWSNTKQAQKQQRQEAKVQAKQASAPSATSAQQPMLRADGLPKSPNKAKRQAKR